MEIFHHQNFANFNTTTKDIKRSFQRIPLPLSRKLTCSAPTEFLPVCLKTLLIGGADFTGARGGKQSSSIKFLWLGFLGFRWLKVASVTMLGIGRGLFKVSPIVHTDFHLKWARNRSFEDAIGGVSRWRTVYGKSATKYKFWRQGPNICVTWLKHQSPVSFSDCKQRRGFCN